MMAQQDLETIRHTAAHVMADAVLKLFPEAKLGIGPAIENGFYYDFVCDERSRERKLRGFSLTSLISWSSWKRCPKMR